MLYVMMYEGSFAVNLAVLDLLNVEVCVLSYRASTRGALGLCSR